MALAAARAGVLAGDVIGVVVLVTPLLVRHARDRGLPGGRSLAGRRSYEHRGPQLSVRDAPVAGDRRRHEGRVRRRAEAVLRELDLGDALGVGAQDAWPREIKSQTLLGLRVEEAHRRRLRARRSRDGRRR